MTEHPTEPIPPQSSGFAGMLNRARTQNENLERANAQQKVSINRLLEQIEGAKGERHELIQHLIDIRYIIKFETQMSNKDKVAKITEYIEKWEKSSE